MGKFVSLKQGTSRNAYTDRVYLNYFSVDIIPYRYYATPN